MRKVVVLSAIWYPMAIARYFEQAFLRRNDLRVYRVGPYTGTRIPWNGEMHLPEKYAIPPDIPIEEGISGKTPFGDIEHLIAETVDLWIQIDAGWYLRGKPSNGIVAHVATDPHALNYDFQRQQSDFFFCMQHTYSKPNDHWLPYAYDPVWHRPVPRDDLLYALGFIGVLYPNRRMLLDAISSYGFQVLKQTGPIFEEAWNLWSQVLIGLNWSSLQDLTARVFELMAMGIPVLCNHVPDLAKVGFTEGKHYLGFDSHHEAVETFTRLVRDEGLRDSLASNAKSVVHPHSWDSRVSEILSVTGALDA